MCIWTLLIFSLLCTLGSCDMEIFALYFMVYFSAFTLCSVAKCVSQAFLYAMINQKNYLFSNLTPLQILKRIYSNSRDAQWPSGSQAVMYIHVYSWYFFLAIQFQSWLHFYLSYCIKELYLLSTCCSVTPQHWLTHTHNTF